MQDGFLESLVKPGKRHPLMNQLLELMEKDVGKPCKKYADNCPSCEAWIAFTRLDSLLEQ